MSFPEHFNTPFEQDEHFHANKSEFDPDQFYPNSLIDDGYQENQSTDETEKAIENVVFNNKNNEDIDNNNENDKISYTEEIYFQKNRKKNLMKLLKQKMKLILKMLIIILILIM